MKKRGNKWIFVSLAIVVVIAVSAIIYFKYPVEKSGFEINRVLVKSLIKEGETLNSTLRIANLGDKNGFKIEILGMEEAVSLNEKNFLLEKNENREIKLSFNEISLPKGIYVGSLKITNGEIEKFVPVILEIQEDKPYFAINMEVSPQYKEIVRGKEIVSKVDFFNLKDTDTHSVQIEYKIFDKEGNSIASENETLILGSKLSIQQSMTVPKNAEKGSYVFATILNFENSTAISSYLFEVSSKKITFTFLNENFFQVFILFLLFIITIIIVYILYERNKLLMSLKSDQKSELKYYSHGIEKQKHASLKKAASSNERKKILNEFNDAKEKIIGKIKELQVEQRRELQKLKGKKSEDYVRKKISKWKKEVFPKALKSAEINSKLKKKLSVLDEAYSSGFISEEAYKKGKSRIESAAKGK